MVTSSTVSFDQSRERFRRACLKEDGVELGSLTLRQSVGEGVDAVEDDNTYNPHVRTACPRRCSLA